MAGFLTFSVEGLEERGELRAEKRLDCALFQECLEGEGALAGPIELQLELSPGDGEVLCRGRLSGEWDLECTRCLSPLRSTYQARFEAELTPEGGAIDAGEEVRQALILAIPAMRYCREDCRGLCPACGANLNERACACEGPAPAARFKVTKKGEHHA